MELYVQFVICQSFQNTAAKSKEHSAVDEETILRKMHRLTDYYDIHKEIGR